MTSIKDFGGEFALIDLINRKPKDKRIIVGIGDDTAVLEYDRKHFMLWTVDMQVEGDHFNANWSTPRQIGRKAMEVNVSDIAAMGGFPKYALVSISLPQETQIEFVHELYKGMREACRAHGFEIVGGNTTHGVNMVIDVSLIGFVEKNRLRLRSNAKVNDLICVTGDLGKSTAGLEALKAGLKGLNVRSHLEPRCRLKEAREISKYANAMIDVSDGLASEVNHICQTSNTGAVVFKDAIPLSRNTRLLASRLNKDPYHFALHGGEDYELVFTIPESKLDRIRLKCQVSVVGRILDRKKGIFMEDNNERVPLRGGYDHFRLKHTS
jgi:thiamine-monophosphate kinase